MDESTEETQARQAAALSGEIDQEVGENGVLVSGGGADARVLRSQEAPDAGAFRWAFIGRVNALLLPPRLFPSLQPFSR